MIPFLQLQLFQRLKFDDILKTIVDADLKSSAPEFIIPANTV